VFSLPKVVCSWTLWKGSHSAWKGYLQLSQAILLITFHLNTDYNDWILYIKFHDPNPSWQAASRSGTPEFPSIFWNPLDNYHVYRHCIYLRLILIFSRLHPGLPSGLSSRPYLTMRAICSEHLILFDMINVTIFGEDCKLCSFYSPIISLTFDPIFSPTPCFQATYVHTWLYDTEFHIHVKLQA
jgi:hypothetical protein